MTHSDKLNQVEKLRHAQAIVDQVRQFWWNTLTESEADGAGITYTNMLQTHIDEACEVLIALSDALAFYKPDDDS